MKRRVAAVAAIVACVVSGFTRTSDAAIASAQGGGKPATGNPTPGTVQPDPPNPANRVIFAGCLQAVTDPRLATPSADPNTPSDARFQLTNAERVNRVPAGTAESPAATSGTSKIYRLEGIDSQFSPFVGAKVEISGEIRPPTAGDKATPPTLLVEFVQRIAASCS